MLIERTMSFEHDFIQIGCSLSGAVYSYGTSEFTLSCAGLSCSVIYFLFSVILFM